jgi:hypothetical protein
MSRDLLITAVAAPSCVRELEVPGSAEPSRNAARQIAQRKTVGSNRFRCLWPGSKTVAEGSQTPCPPRLARPGSGELSLHCVSRRIDRPSSPLRSPNTENGQEVEIDRSVQ